MQIAMLTSAAIVALLLWLIWLIGARSQRPRRITNNAVPEGRYRHVTTESGGKTLRGWLLLPETAEPAAPLPAVVVMHGWGSNRTRVLRYTKPLREAGWAVLMYDARSHGDSDIIKAPSALMFRDDVVAAVASARSMTEIAPDRIAVLGHSLGGFGALLALARGLPVRAVVTDSMPTRFETMLKAELKRRRIPFFPLGLLIPPIWLLRAGISRSEYNAAQIPVALAANATGRRIPILMVHAKGDTFIPADDLRQLKRPDTAEAMFVEGHGHSESERDPAFWSRVIPFLKEHLS